MYHFVEYYYIFFIFFFFFKQKTAYEIRSICDFVGRNKCAERKIQCNKETVYRTSGWLSWAVHRGLVWRLPSRGRHRAPTSLSAQATRNEFRRRLNRLAETRRDKPLTCPTKRPSKPFLPYLAL